MGSLRGGGGGGMEEAAAIPMVDADEACALLSAATHQYLDVRMWEDFDKGHVAGARNVPYYLSVTPHGKEKNPHFVEQVSALYPNDQHLIVGCRSGIRSKLATADLLAAGFKNGQGQRRAAGQRQRKLSLLIDHGAGDLRQV
uniref:Rhodanese domain-containing protein n=1 Tax=Setaria italica TaxID=4555 RepID=K3YWJ1_SETIT